MIVLDTNVVSEPLRPAADAAVLAWLDAQDIETLYLTTVTLAELRHGVAALPEGRRRKTLQTALEVRIVPLFGPRILAFDAVAAGTYAQVRLRAATTGTAIGAADSYIAATAAAHGFAIATRDVAPFAAAGLTVINPWRA